MSALNDHVTPEVRTLLAALVAGAGDADQAAALALIGEWADGELQQSEDSGWTRLSSPARGIQLQSTQGRASAITFELAANPHYDAFPAPTRLIHGLDASTGKAELRALIGPPLESAYGNDSYLLDGVDAVVCLGWRSSGQLQRLMLLSSEPDELARLRRKAAKAKGTGAATSDVAPVVIEVPEEDGILGLVDPDAYVASLPDWSFDSLTGHLETETGAGHGVFWRAGPAEFATYAITVRTTPSDRAAVREVENVVHASRGRLRLVGWGGLTTAADSESERLPDDPDAEMTTPATRLSVRIRQLAVGPDDADEIPVEIVLQPLGRRRTKPQPRLAWWTD